MSFFRSQALITVGLVLETLLIGLFHSLSSLAFNVYQESPGSTARFKAIRCMILAGDCRNQILSTFLQTELLTLHVSEMY